jgi:hypothetical protein
MLMNSKTGVALSIGGNTFMYDILSMFSNI